MLLEDGTWCWGEECIALSPGDCGWDNVHVCDPDILQGKFGYNEHTYSWALFYLGCDLLDCNHNQIGVAFSDSIEGPWVKFDANPVVTGALAYWGTGQCSEVSIDRKGKFNLIYRDVDEMGSHYKIAVCDFSDMTHYEVGEPIILPKIGLPDTHLCMSHVAYDVENDTLYLAAEKDWDGVVRYSQEIVIAFIIGDELERGVGKWGTLGIINSTLTNKYGNHNAAIGRDSYGRITKLDELPIYISSATQTFIWSFRIEEIVAHLTRE